MEITLEEIQKKFASLPEDLRWAIMAAKVDEKVTAIGQMHGLNIEQLGQLSLETHMVMLGYTHPDKFEESLKGSMGLPDEKNREIVMEINNKILKDIREKLVSLRKKEDAESKEEKRTPLEETIIENNNEPEDKTKDLSLEKERQNKKIMESISFQKLSGSFQAPTTKTEYSLNNLSKNQEKTGTSSDQNVKIPLEGTIKPVSSETASVSPSYSIKDDPYRVKPE
ncbi:MAG: hypothetical protein WCO07_02865 [bacterium]